MAIGDLIKRTILAEFRADISQAAREIDALIAKQDKLGASAQSAARAQSAHFDQLVLDLTRANKGAQDASLSWDGWKKQTESTKMSSEQLFSALAKGAVVLGTVAAAVDFGRDSLKSWGEQLRLETKAAGINMDELSGSFDGLINQHDLLQFATSTSTGVLKLNQQQMETIGQAALALRERGIDLSTSFEKLRDAAVKGKVEGLDDLGLAIEKGESNAETLKNMMAELNKVITESGGKSKNTADDVDRLAVAWDNAKEKVKGYAAQAILAASVDVSPESLKKRMSEAGWSQFRALFPDDSWYKTQRAFATGLQGGRQQVRDQSVIQMDDLDVSRSDTERKKMAEDAASAAANAILRTAVASTERNTASVSGFNKSGGSLGMKADETIRNDYGVAQDYVGEGIKRTDDFYSKVRTYEESLSDRTESKLAKMFGPIDEFKSYEIAFGSLQTAATSAMSAWISGSMTMGQAIKKGIGDALGGAATQLLAESLKHGLFAIGSLAYGDVAGAGRHAAAAAAFGAGAVTMAGLARSLNGSVASTSGAAPGVGGGSSGSAGSKSSDNGGPTNVRDRREGRGDEMSPGAPLYFIVGEHFTEMSPRQRAIEADQTVRRALGSTGSRDS